MMSDLPSQLEKVLDELSESQLRRLNHTVVEKLKLLSKAEHLRGLARFNVLDRVFFHHHGQRVTGTIVRLNQKTASIKTDEGENWNVVPSFLTRLQEVKEDPFMEVATKQEAYPGAARNAVCPCGSGRKYKKCCL